MTDPRATHAAPPVADEAGAALAGPSPDAIHVAGHAHSVKAASMLPSWMGSIRFRMTVVYSVILFSLASIVVAVIYMGLVRTLNEIDVTKQVDTPLGYTADGRAIVLRQEFIDESQAIEKAANTRAITTLRNYSYGALGALFATSLVVGWFVSGRLLRPIGRITRVAQDIQATDLSRRIELQGPDDELKKLADTFDDMLGRIDDAFRSQRDFIHEASHELRNPLAVIRTNVEVTLSDPDASAEDLRHTAEVVQTSSERMSRLVDDLLVYARKGSLSMERDTVDVGGIIGEAVQEFAASASAAGVRLESFAPEGLFVDGDRLALRQALANLIANAIRVSSVDTVVRVTAGLEDPWVWIAVSDQGPGIAAEDRERVFQRFWRGEPSQERGEVRSGLGLTIVRQVAEAHGGEVKLVSEPGKGSAFAIWLPPAAPAPTPAPAEPGTSPGGQADPPAVGA